MSDKQMIQVQVPKYRNWFCTWGTNKELSTKHEAFFSVNEEGVKVGWHMHADGTECRKVMD